MWELLAEVAAIPQGVLLGAVLVFVRVGAIAALLPGFGEQSLPGRVRLTVALALTVTIYPLVFPILPRLPDNVMSALPLILSEAAIGLAFGLSIRLLVMALQFAGSIAAQSTAIAQMMGPGATPDPMPAIGNILILSGVTLALVAGLHVKAVSAIAETYSILPMGRVPAGSDIAAWGMSHAARAFSLAFTLAAPFVIASVAYNLALGFINRAMPQLMVAFIGAPAISGLGILILALAAPTILAVWSGRVDEVLARPFELPR